MHKGEKTMEQRKHRIFASGWLWLGVLALTTGLLLPPDFSAPMIGGMATSTILTLLVIPAVYALWRSRGLSKE